MEIFEVVCDKSDKVPVTEQYPMIKKLTGIFDIKVKDNYESDRYMAQANSRGIEFNNYHREKYNEWLILRILFHEIAHCLMHVNTPDQIRLFIDKETYARIEVEAETTANTILKRIGASEEVLKESDEYIKRYKEIIGNACVNTNGVERAIERIYDAYLSIVDETYKKIKEAV